MFQHVAAVRCCPENSRGRRYYIYSYLSDDAMISRFKPLEKRAAGLHGLKRTTRLYISLYIRGRLGHIAVVICYTLRFNIVHNSPGTEHGEKGNELIIVRAHVAVDAFEFAI